MQTFCALNESNFIWLKPKVLFNEAYVLLAFLSKEHQKLNDEVTEADLGSNSSTIAMPKIIQSLQQ